MKKTIYLILFLYLFLFFFFLFVGAGNCQAGARGPGRVLLVPNQYATIQAAIDAAQHQDTVLVSEGSYYENITYRGKGIVVSSRYSATKDWQTVVNTIIDGSTATDKDNASTVQLMNAEDSTTVLDGFTITGGTGTRWVFGSNTPQEGGGIILGYSSATIRNNIIRNNVTRTSAGVISGGGGGISSMYGNPTICNNVIVSNLSGYAGGIVLNYSRGKIRNNIICHNATTGQYGGGGMMIWQAPQNGGIVENNTIVNNLSSADGGGITMSVTDPSTVPVVRNNIIWGNRQAVGRQVAFPEYVHFNTIEDCASGSNISSFPHVEEGSFLLSGTSPCVDAGDPNGTCYDLEDPGHPGMAAFPSRGSVRNDVGAYGGGWARILPSLDIVDLRVSGASLSMSCASGLQVTSACELLNRGSRKVTVDSVSFTTGSAFSLVGNPGQVFDVLSSDSLRVCFQAAARGRTVDTLRVSYHAAGTAGCIKIPVFGMSNSTPVLRCPIPPQTAYVGREFTLHIPDSTFVDSDAGDSLAYQATGMPSWLTFNPQTHSFQGMPASGTVGIPLSIGIVVRDMLQASASTSYVLMTHEATAVDKDQVVPEKLALFQNYPNPFNPTTVIRYQLPLASDVRLVVYDILGRPVAGLVMERQPAGSYTVKFDGSGLASGVYLYRLQAGDVVRIRTLLLLR